MVFFWSNAGSKIFSEQIKKVGDIHLTFIFVFNFKK
jgi:hypothetical protein